MGSTRAKTHVSFNLVSACAAALLLSVMLAFWDHPLMAADWKNGLYPAARLAAQGQMPYSSLGVYHPQPLFSLLVPIALIGEFAGYLALALLTIAAVLWAHHAFAREKGVWWSLLFTIFSYPFLSVLWWGQLSGLEVLAVVFSYEAWQLRKSLSLGVAYALMVFLLPNLVLIVAYWLWETINRWHWRQVVLSILLPLSILLASFVLYGLWPVDWYLALGHKTGLSNFTSFWTLPIPRWLKLLFAIIPLLLVIILWPAEPTPTGVAFLLASSYLVSPYITTYRLLVVYAVTLPVLVYSLWSGLFYWIISFLPLLGPWVEWPPYVDLAHVLIIAAVYFPFLRFVRPTPPRAAGAGRL